jgi:hypothetical protein
VDDTWLLAFGERPSNVECDARIVPDGSTCVRSGEMPQADIPDEAGLGEAMAYADSTCPRAAALRRRSIALP